MALSIHISLEETQVQCGSPIALRVEFKNDGATPTTFLEPARTWELGLAVSRPSAAKPASLTPFGKLFFTSYRGVERHTTESAADITLGPGETHAFVEDVGSRWPHLFAPGEWQLQVIDRTNAGELASNVVSLYVVFAEDSLPKLFDIAERPSPKADPQRQSSEDGILVLMRTFAAEWIGRVQPGFQLDPVAADAAAEARNKAAVAEARALFQRQLGSSALLEKIREINHRASRPPSGGESN